MKSSIHVACLDGTVFCKITGLGRMQNSFSLRSFAEQAFLDGFRQFIIDLKDCTGMDSTFMGTLLGIQLLKKESISPLVVLVNVSQENYKLLEGLGLSKVLKIEKKPMEPPQMELIEVQEEKLSQREWLQNIYEAHKNLVELHPENKKKFGNFVKTLFKELS
ncbi:MAG: anti-sigma factor antagonist [Planctomycetota bacterium]|nr:MAG: anti-sigma factor antagonist [Planctomycetota bacterium]